MLSRNLHGKHPVCPAYSVSCRGPALDSGYNHLTMLGDNLEEYAPVAHAAAQTWKTLQFADITTEGTLPHFVWCNQNTFSIRGRHSVKRLSCGSGEENGPFHSRNLPASHSLHVYMRPCRDGRHGPRQQWAAHLAGLGQ